jgi:hypothetical protein
MRTNKDQAAGPEAPFDYRLKTTGKSGKPRRQT